MITTEEIHIIQHLRQETSRDILLTLLKNNELEFHEIKIKIKKSSSTTSQNISKLVNSNLIFQKMDNSKKIFYVKNGLLIRKLIKKYNFD